MFKPIYNFFHNHYHRRYHGIYQHAKQLFVFDMVLLALALVLFGASAYFFAWKPGVGRDVQISVSLGTERIKSGENVQLTVEYTNNSKVKLENSVLAVRLPRGFIIDQNLNQNLDTKNHIVDIGPLPPGSHGIVKIYGTLWTNVNETEKIIATLSFKPEGNQNTDQSSGVYLLTLSDSVLSATLNSPTKVFSDQKIPFQIDIKNNSPKTLSDIRLNLNGKPLTKPIELPNSSSTVFSGTITTPAKGGNYYFTTDVRVVIDGKSFTQKVFKKYFEIFSPRITLSARLENTPSYAETNSVLPLQIMWKNESQFSLKNQKIILQTTPGVVDIAETAKENHLTADGNNLVIDGKARTTLADGKPNSGDQFTIKLILLPNFDKKTIGINTLAIKPVFEATVEAVDNQIFNASGAGASIKLAAEVFLQTEARYYSSEGDQLGRGPLPPQVSKTTKYWIFATLFDKVNPVHGGRLTLNLAPGVTFTGKQSLTIGSELIYNPVNHTLNWSYDNVIPADSESGFYFEVSITPKTEQVGYLVNLLTGASFFGVDDEVGKEFNIKLNNTSNILPKTDKGNIKGAVVTP